MLVTSPWRRFSAPDAEKECLAMLSYFVLEGLWALPGFSWNVLLIGRQLARSEGLVGYSVGVRLGTLKFLALSVWEDERALQRFVRAQPHANIMKAMRPRVAEAGFVRWEMDGASFPPTGGRP